MTPQIPKTPEVIAAETHMQTCPQCSKEPTQGDDAALCEEGFRLLQEAIRSVRRFAAERGGENMTPDQLIEQCRLAIRWAESVKSGKEIEIQMRMFNGEWANRFSNQWYFTSGCEYREKPKEPRRWKVGINHAGVICSCSDCTGNPSSEIVEVVEVLR